MRGTTSRCLCSRPAPGRSATFARPAGVAADAVGSVGVLIGAAVIAATSWYWVDSLIAIGIGIFILPRAYKLGRDGLRILVESAPAHIDVDELAQDLQGIDMVVEAHDLHVWTITSGMDAVSVHLQVHPDADTHAVLDQAREVPPRPAQGEPRTRRWSPPITRAATLSSGDGLAGTRTAIGPRAR